MDTAELLDALEAAGLSQYQSEAYATLLRLGAVSATGLADACAVPTARIYDVLRDLEAKGYIETYEQDSLHARARDPEDVLSGLRARAAQLTTAAEEIERRWEEPDVDRHKVSIVKRFDTVFNRAEALVSEAENEVLVSATPAQFRTLRPALRAARDREVVVKVSIHTKRDDPESNLPDGADLAGAVTEARHRTLPAPFVALVDRTDACFAPYAHSMNQYGVLVDDYTLTYVFHWYFKTCLWEVWSVLYSARPTEPPLAYADLRRCVRDVKPLIEGGAAVRAHIEGFDIESSDPVAFTGTVTDVRYSGMGTTSGSPPLSQLAGHVSLMVAVDDGIHTVGAGGRCWRTSRRRASRSRRSTSSLTVA